MQTYQNEKDEDKKSTDDLYSLPLSESGAVDETLSTDPMPRILNLKLLSLVLVIFLLLGLVLFLYWQPIKQKISLRINNNSMEQQSDSMVHIPAQKVTVINSVGAGDSFNAGFLSHLLRGHDIFESAQFANAVAARKISTLGTLSFSDMYDI